MNEKYIEDDASSSTKLTYLLIGGGIGAVLALLFAPKPGVELRNDIADATRKGIDKGRETATQLQDSAGEYYEITRDRANELYAEAQETVDEYAKKAKATAAQNTNSISAAIDAGKAAYEKEKRKNEVDSIVEGRPTWAVKKDDAKAEKKEEKKSK